MLRYLIGACALIQIVSSSGFDPFRQYWRPWFAKSHENWLQDQQPQNWTIVPGCIVASMNVSINVNLGSNKSLTIEVDPSKDVKATGNCTMNNSDQMLKLTWTEVDMANKSVHLGRSIIFEFAANETAKIYGIASINGALDILELDSKNKTMVKTVYFNEKYSPVLISNPLGNSLKCTSGVDINLNSWYNSTDTTPTTTPASTTSTTTTHTTSTTTTHTTTTTTHTTTTTTTTKPTTTTTVTTTTTTLKPTTTTTTTLKPTTTTTTEKPTTTSTTTEKPKTTTTTEKPTTTTKKDELKSEDDKGTTTTTTTKAPTTTTKAPTTTTKAPTTTSNTPTTTVSPNMPLKTVISLTNINLDVFRNTTMKPTEYQASVECAGDDAGKPSDIIPIVVGAVLAGLIVLTLIAYLIGRKMKINEVNNTYYE